MKKLKLAMNQLVYLDFTILRLSNLEMYSFWYDYIKKI